MQSLTDDRLLPFYWLQEVGFARGNPFASQEADRERPLLSEFFVDPGDFLSIVGDPAAPTSTLVYAPRGHGKTACMLMIQHECRPFGNELPVLAVPGVLWDRLLARRAETGAVTIDDHVDEILAVGLPLLLDSLCAEPQYAARLSPPHRAQLAWMCRRFAPETLSAAALALRLGRDFVQDNESWVAFQTGVRDRAIGPTLQARRDVDPRLVALLVALVDGQPEPMRENAGPVRHFGAFVELAVAAGFQSVYVLLDRLDETRETANDMEALATLLEPLAASLALIERAASAFKIFLPQEARAAIEGRCTFRPDRVRSYEIRWTPESLLELLRRRLSAYSEDHIQALAQLTQAPLSSKIDAELVQLSGGSPRRLLRLAELLFRQVSRPGRAPTSLLTSEDWEAARHEFFRDHAPALLQLDLRSRRGYRGKQVIELTALEYDFLIALQRSGGWRKKEDMIAAVWKSEAGVTDQAVSQLVRRIREKIEPNPAEPVYLRTEHRLGFRLEHAELVPAPPGAP